MGKVFEDEDFIIRTDAQEPNTPEAGRISLYAKSDGIWTKNSAGVEARLSNDVAGTNGPASYRATLLGDNGALTSTTVAKALTVAGTAVTITGAYSAEGVYTLTAGAGTPFTADKTTVRLTLGTATGGVVLKAAITSTTVITITSFLVTDGTTAADFIGTVFVDVTIDV